MLFTTFLINKGIFNECSNVVFIYIMWTINWTFSTANAFPLTNNYYLILWVIWMWIMYIHNNGSQSTITISNLEEYVSKISSIISQFPLPMPAPILGI